MRVNISDENQLRTTVDQRVVELPSLKKVCHIFQKVKLNFHLSFLKDLMKIIFCQMQINLQQVN